jgi:sterol desaturase/sphingolipid hydroxylase (fatty acid hydroxylase superfamily)
VRYFLQLVYAPTLFLGVVVSGVFLLEAGGSKLGLVGLVLSAIFLSFAVERVIPYRADWNRDHNDRARDQLHFLVNEGSAVLAIMVVPIIADIRPWTGVWPLGWPLWIQLFSAILIADFGITLAHFASHRVTWLWRLHAVHHSVKRMYGFNGLMKHPLHQLIETVAGTMPLLLLGIPVEAAALLAVAVAVQLLLQHSNVDMKIGPLRYFWAIAPLHRFHHLNTAREGDVNFGLFTTLWDRLLGTAHYDPARHFSSDALGVFGAPDYPSAYLPQLIKPFSRDSAAT